MNAFRNSALHFQCPVSNCQASYMAGPDLQLHINEQHVFHSNPSASQQVSPHPAQQPTITQNANPLVPYPQQLQLVANAHNAPEKSTHVPQHAGRLPNRNQTQLQSAMDPGSGIHPLAPVYQNRHVENPHAENLHPGNVNQDLVASPLMNPRSVSPRLIPPQLHAISNPQSMQCIWPPLAESYLRTLLQHHGLYGKPPGETGGHELLTIFNEFRTTFGLEFMGLAASDDRIPNMFGSKVKEVQEMIMKEQGGERTRARDAKRTKRVHQPPVRRTTSDHPVNQSIVPASMSTPPLTPIVSTTMTQNSLEGIWASSNAGAQIHIFRQLLRTAKSPPQIRLEWERWQAEMCRAGHARVDVEGKLAGNMQVTLVSTPPVDMEPEAAEATDLDSMIERGLRENRLKRDRAKAVEIQRKSDQHKEEENPAKRMKTAAT